MVFVLDGRKPKNDQAHVISIQPLPIKKLSTVVWAATMILKMRDKS